MTEPSQYFKGRTVQEQMNEVIGYVDTRSAEVATTAIASDVAQVHQDMLDADADASAAAASAAAAAGTLANAVKKTGEASQNIEGDVNLTTGGLAVSGDAAVQGNFSVIGDCEVGTPVNNTDAANKKYVDDADALKLNITDVNSYALGLTGNQNAAGNKTFEGVITANGGISYLRGLPTADGNWYCVYRSKNAESANTFYGKALALIRRYRGVPTNNDFGIAELHYQGGIATRWKFWLAGNGVTPANFKALVWNNKAYFYLKTNSAADRLYFQFLFTESNGTTNNWLEYVNEQVTDASEIAAIEAAPDAVI